MSVFENWLTRLRNTSHISSATLDLVFRKEAANYAITAAFDFSEERLYSYLTFVYDLERGLGDSEGSFRGPFQFSKIAWRDVSRDNWEVDSVDPTLSTRAALDYFLLNYSRYVKSGFDPSKFTNEIGYLYHNQGPSAAKHYLLHGELRFPDQSRAAREVFRGIMA